MKINLAEKRDEPQMVEAQAKEKGPYYPCLYINNNPNLDGVAMDQTVTLTGRVKGVRKDERDGKITYGADIEVTEMETGAADKAKKQPKKSNAATDEDEIENGLKSAEKNGSEKEGY